MAMRKMKACQKACPVQTYYHNLLNITDKIDWNKNKWIYRKKLKKVPQLAQIHFSTLPTEEQRTARLTFFLKENLKIPRSVDLHLHNSIKTHTISTTE